MATSADGRARDPAPVADFAGWLDEAGQTDGMDRRRLLLLYGEFCLDTDSEQLTEAQLLRRARAAGIERYRLSTGRRQWRYRLRMAELIELAKGRRVP